jgi:hypothetical protein
VQYLLIFLVLFYVFGGVACLVLCGIKSVFLVLALVIPSSHNIVTSLCCCNVDSFILVIAILRYDYKPTLNTIVKKLFIFVNHEPTFESIHSKPPLTKFPPISCSPVPCIFAHHFESFDDVCKMHV